MATQPGKPRILQAIDALQALDRDRAAHLLQEELRAVPATGERWKSVGRLAAEIGEIDIALEAARRFALTAPVNLERMLFYWGELAYFGRAAAANEALHRLPPEIARHPAVLHLWGTLAGQEGDFATAERQFRAALAQTPLLPETWFALAMFKTFAPGDPDVAEMERLRPAFDRGEPATRARFLYGLAKAYDDCGDHDRAFALYSEGAALRRQEERWDRDETVRFVDAVIRDFTPRALSQLTPSEERRPALFVNGLPRSGTTLAEQILVSHSAVLDGGEINLLRPALIPTGDHSLAGAMAYQQRFSGKADPWGALAKSYFRMLRMHFPGEGLIVDKTLVQSRLMGLLVHMLPDARVVWMRRNPEDTALSCFRTFFTGSLPWTWSLDDIGLFFRLEDRLHAHWTALFPENILTVPYEELASAPEQWIPRIAAHCGLQPEPQMLESHKTKRGVLTASVQQVRAPISTGRVGVSAAYHRHLDPFRAAYTG